MQQTFARGRSKTVTVEVKKKHRTLSKDVQEEKIETEPHAPEEQAHLTKEEQEARLKALKRCRNKA